MQVLAIVHTYEDLSHLLSAMGHLNVCEQVQKQRLSRAAFIPELMINRHAGVHVPDAAIAQPWSESANMLCTGLLPVMQP